MYFDNVGGDHLEAALAALRRAAASRCAAPSRSTTRAAPAGPRNLFQATANDLTLRGFRGSQPRSSHPGPAPRHERVARRGAVKIRETVFDGLERAPEAIVAQIAGATTGKSLVRVV